LSLSNTFTRSSPSLIHIYDRAPRSKKKVVKKAAVPLPKKVDSLAIKREKNADKQRAWQCKMKGIPVPEQKKNLGRKSIVVVENRDGLKRIKRQAIRVLGSFTDKQFKNILRARDLKALNHGVDVVESKEFFSNRFRKMTTFKSKASRKGPKPAVPDWVALCVYTKLSTEYQAVAMFDNVTLAANLMGKGFSRQTIQEALNSTPENKRNFSGTSGIINADDVCHWRYVKRQ